jgi:hypothetical protein
MNTFSLILLSLILVSGLSLRAEPASDRAPIHLEAQIAYKTTAEKDLRYIIRYNPFCKWFGFYLGTTEREP